MITVSNTFRNACPQPRRRSPAAPGGAPGGRCAARMQRRALGVPGTVRLGLLRHPVLRREHGRGEHGGLADVDVVQHLHVDVHRGPEEEVAVEAELHDLYHEAAQVHPLLYGAVHDADLVHALRQSGGFHA